MYKNKQYLFGKEYFEEGEGLRSKRVYNWETTEVIFRVIANSLNDTFRPKRILDIGCAKGYLVYLLQELGIDAYGVDISFYAVSCAPEEVKDKLYALDIEQENFPFPDNHFDMIILIAILEHLDHFDILLNRIKNILRDKGYVFVIVPTPWGRYATADKTHINVQPKRYWVQLFNKSGFILVKNDIWHHFKIKFLKELKRAMSKIPPSTKISSILKNMGTLGNGIRNNLIPYIDYFSPFRSNEIMVFKKIT